MRSLASHDFGHQVKIDSFFTTRVDTRIVPVIFAFQSETFQYNSLFKCFTRIAFTCSNSTKLSEIFSKVQQSRYITYSKEGIVLCNGLNLSGPLPTKNLQLIGTNYVTPLF